MTRVFIGRLPHEIEEKQIHDFFRDFRSISNVTLKQGYGFVVSFSLYFPKNSCWEEREGGGKNSCLLGWLLGYFITLITNYLNQIPTHSIHQPSALNFLALL